MPTTSTTLHKSLNNIALLLLFIQLLNSVDAFGASKGSSANGIKTRSFVFTQKSGNEKPKLVLISGCPGTGKSTFGMSVALDQGILKCISTDTVRAVMRSFIPKHISPALHRSSYAKANEKDDEPVISWLETCDVLEASVEEIITDSIARRQGLVLEGVSIAPSKKWIDAWEEAGGVATGCLLTVSNPETHKFLLQKRGFLAGTTSEQNAKDQKKIQSFDRIRAIQDEMVRLANESGWTLIEQKVQPDPLEIIAGLLSEDDCTVPAWPTSPPHDAENFEKTHLDMKESNGKIVEQNV